MIVTNAVTVPIHLIALLAGLAQILQESHVVMKLIKSFVYFSYLMPNLAPPDQDFQIAYDPRNNTSDSKSSRRQEN
jgi:hypothetical protein